MQRQEDGSDHSSVGLVYTQHVTKADKRVDWCVTAVSPSCISWYFLTHIRLSLRMTGAAGSNGAL